MEKHKKSPTDEARIQTKDTKKSFILYHDSLSILDEMDNEMAGRFFKAIYKYQLTGQLPDEVDLVIRIAITPFINQFKRENEKWEQKKANLSANGKKGGRPRKNQTKPNAFSNNQTKPNAFSDNQTETKKAVNVKVSVNEKVNDTVSDKEDHTLNSFDFELLRNTQYFESIVRLIGLKKISTDEVSQYFDKFKLEMEAKDDLYRKEHEYRNHFVNWIKIQVENREKPNKKLPVGHIHNQDNYKRKVNF